MKKILIILKKTINKILSTLVDCVVPILPALIGAGMVKVVLIIFGPLVLNILSETSNTYIVLNFVADAGYYFLPIYVSVSSAEVFKTNKYVAALIGAMLLSPTYVDMVNNGTTLSIFSLPIASTNYANQIISSIIAIFVMSYIYSFVDAKIHESFRPILVPLITIIIMVPIAFCAIGPLGVFLGDKLVELIILLNSVGPIGNAIMCAIIPFITIAGLGGANISAMLLLASTGCDPILFYANVMYNSVLGFVTLAIYFKKRNANALAAALTSALAGTSEPALFGHVVKDNKALISLVIGDFIGGLLAGIFRVKSYAIASFGIFGVMTTIGPGSSLLGAIISIVIGCLTGFILSFLTHPKEK